MDAYERRLVHLGAPRSTRARSDEVPLGPPSITVEMAKGFSLYMLKAIIGGRGDDLVDLARTNLWQ
jgi:hypothetical protein